METWEQIESGVRRAVSGLVLGESEAEDLLNSLLEGRLRAVSIGADATLVLGTIPRIDGGERIYAAAGGSHGARGVAARIAEMFAKRATTMVDLFTPHRAMPRLVRSAVSDLEVEVDVQPIWHVVVRRK